MKSAQRKVHSIIFLLAILLAALVTVITLQNTNPFNFKLTENPTPVHRVTKVFFRDLENNGISERIAIYNSQRDNDTFHLNVYRDDYQLINQWNLTDSILIQDLSFLDLNNDNCKEIIIWTQSKDSLFLSIIDIKNPNDFIIDNTFVLNRPKRDGRRKWDIKNIDSHSLLSKPLSILFTIQSGHSKYPRGVYLFDLLSKRITNEFLCNAAITKSIVFDINNDGLEELIIATSATNNFNKDARYSDAYSWLLILDQDLNIVFEHRADNSYGAIVMKSGIINAKPFLYAFSIHGNRNTNILKLNQKLEIIQNITLKGFATIIYNIDQSGLLNLFLKGWKTSKFIVTDSNFVLIDSLIYDSVIEPQETLDIDGNGLNNYYYYGYNELVFLDENFRKIAIFELFEAEDVFDISLKLNRKKDQTISINTNKNSYLIKIVPSFYYKWVWLLSVLQGLLYYLVLLSLHWVINKIRVYVSYFTYSLHQSDNAIILLNHKKEIVNFNKKVEGILGLGSPLKRKQNYKEALSPNIEIISTIEECLTQNKNTKKEIAFDNDRKSFIGTISVTPFFGFFQILNAHLIEIQDSTEQVISERRINWQRNLRRMIHDIKNPLAGVQLKLQSIYLKILDENPKLANTLENEIEIANSEIKRIRNISKDFLKFSDLELIKLENVNIKNTINQCINHFKAFLNSNLVVEENIEETLPIVKWDQRQIELLLHILFENAIDALKGKGQLYIEASLVQNLNDSGKNLIKLIITDNGCGILDEHKNKIFLPNFSLKSEGSGMGLVFAKQIVQQHQGTIQLINIKDYSTAFEIVLPVELVENADMNNV